MGMRLHNIIFALLLGIILGVTAYAIHVRLPSVGLPHYLIEIPRSADSKESSKKKTSKTERMIEAGELSDHEAKYYKVLPQ
jgi:hypothetical protein